MKFYYMIVNDKGDYYIVPDEHDDSETLYKISERLSMKEFIEFLNENSIEFIHTELSNKYKSLDDAVIECEKPFKKVQDLNKKMLEAEAFDLDWSPSNCTMVYFEKRK